MNYLHVAHVFFLGCTKLATVVTVFGEGSVVIQPMSVQTVWKCELLSTLFTRQGLGGKDLKACQSISL